LLFAANKRNFKFDDEGLREAASGVSIADMSKKTLPRDFERSANLHHVFRLGFRTTIG